MAKPANESLRRWSLNTRSAHSLASTLPIINLKVSMPLTLLKIDFALLGVPESAPSPSVTSWSFCSVVKSRGHETCGLIQLIRAMPTPCDRKEALTGLRKLIQVAAAGEPLPEYYDSNQCYETHSFHHDVHMQVLNRLPI